MSDLCKCFNQLGPVFSAVAVVFAVMAVVLSLTGLNDGLMGWCFLGAIANIVGGLFCTGMSILMERF
jgi:hypothetical protein